MAPSYKEKLALANRIRNQAKTSISDLSPGVHYKIKHAKTTPKYQGVGHTICLTIRHPTFVEEFHQIYLAEEYTAVFDEELINEINGGREHLTFLYHRTFGKKILYEIN